MKTATSALILIGILATPVMSSAETIRPKPRPQLVNLSKATVTPVSTPDAGDQMALMLFQATSFCSAASMITGTPLFILPK